MESGPIKENPRSEIARLFSEDQKDRADWADESSRGNAFERDRIRLAKAKMYYEEIKSGKLSLPEESYFQLALLFQHSHIPEDYKTAMELCVLAGDSGRNLYACAEDRYLLSIGEKQIWGTQYTRSQEGEVVLAEMEDDSVSGITDEMRLSRELPKRAELQKTWQNV